MEKLIKIALAILFLLCLLNMPYGYYQMVRFLGFLGFCILGYYSKQRNEMVLMIIYFALALLFQPFLKVLLGRALWNLIDVAAAIFLLLTLFRKEK